MAAGAAGDIMEQIKIRILQKTNWCVADLLNKWVKENGGNFARDHFFSAHIIKGGVKYYPVDGVKVEKHDDGTETVTVYLVARD